MAWVNPCRRGGGRAAAAVAGRVFLAGQAGRPGRTGECGSIGRRIGPVEPSLRRSRSSRRTYPPLYFPAVSPARAGPASPTRQAREHTPPRCRSPAALLYCAMDHAHPPLPAPDCRRRLSLYWKLSRGDRPIGWLLLLWPTWWGLWIAAGGVPPLWTLFVFSAGVWLTRAAGCVINDYADRWLDPHVERTRNRPLATGELRGREALAVFAALMLVAFALVLTMNRLTVLMSVVGVALAASYPYLKRYTHLPQVYLGMAFGWGIPMAFAAVRGEVPAVAWLLYVANILWSTAYDTWYAMVDREDDLKMGSKSTAILFGDLDLVAIGVLYALMFAALALAGQRAGLGLWYYAGLLVALALVVYEFIIARGRERERCFRAFLHNHWVGLTIFAGLALDYLLRGAHAAA